MGTNFHRDFGFLCGRSQSISSGGASASAVGCKAEFRRSYCVGRGSGLYFLIVLNCRALFGPFVMPMTPLVFLPTRKAISDCTDQLCADYSPGWSSENSVRLNVREARVVHTGTRPGAAVLRPPAVDGALLKCVDRMRFLGITVDSWLNFGVRCGETVRFYAGTGHVA